MPAAVLLPETVLLVPGASGRSPVLEELRRIALEAVAEHLAGPWPVLVLAPAPRTRHVAEPCASLAAAGPGERFLRWPPPCAERGCAHTAGRVVPGAAAGLRLLAAAGHRGRGEVLELGPEPPAAEIADQHLLVLGSLSARRAEDSPRAHDPRAAATDAALAAALASGDVAALAALDPDLLGALDVTGLWPWRHLATALCGHRPEARALGGEEDLGMDYRAFAWRWAR